eukprot:7390148-Prymnesium_polylepis.2
MLRISDHIPSPMFTPVFTCPSASGCSWCVPISSSTVFRFDVEPMRTRIVYALRRFDTSSCEIIVGPLSPTCSKTYRRKIT